MKGRNERKKELWKEGKMEVTKERRKEGRKEKGRKKIGMNDGSNG